MKVQCFGNFEVYIDSYPCPFKYIKTKELLAYLVDRRGAFCSNGEILGALWEDKEVTVSLENYLRNLVSDLRSVLKEYKLEDVIGKKKGMIRVVPELFECDYYKWIDGDPAAINSFNGEYMSQYSWAESTLAGMENRMDN
jgi:two-component SAPR family response regulator